MPEIRRFLAVLALAALWPTFAAADSASRVVDLLPGPTGGVTSFQAVPLGTGIVFVGRDSNVAAERLWEYDGTGLPILVPGQPNESGWPMRLTRWHDEAYFVSNLSGGIWRYDGVATTELVLPAAQVGFPLSLAPFTVPPAFDLLCLSGTTGATGAELFCWEGSGVLALHEIAPGVASSSPESFAQLGAALYFAASDAAGDRELWRFNGIDAPALFADLRSSGASSPRGLLAAAGHLYFQAFDDGGALRLWSTDGAAAPAPVSPTFLVREGSDLGLFRGDVIVQGHDEALGGPARLWRFDGSGLTRLPVGALADYGFARPTVHQGALYWWAGCGCSGNDLVRYAGAGAPALVTEEFQDLDMVTGGLVSAAGLLFFTATDSEAGGELWEHSSSLLFADGLESGDTGWWSSSVP